MVTETASTEIAQTAPPRRLWEQSVRYARESLRRDAVAGLTVAVMGVPQAMGYALIAGLPPIYGLYTSIVVCTVAALFGSSNHLVTGPTNALCMVILSMTAHLPAKYGVNLLETILLLTFMTGLVQVTFGVLRMGGIVRYVSNSVVVGFTAGAGILIAVNQLRHVFGLQMPAAHAERAHEVLWGTLSRLPDTNFFALGVAVFTAAAVVVLPRLNRRLPGPLVGIAVSGAAVYAFGWYDAAAGAAHVRVVQEIAPITRSLDLFHFPRLLVHPQYELTRELGSGAVALAILGLIEAASIARATAAASGQRLNFTREFIGQGVGNMAGAFFLNFAGSGSFTRTAVCYSAGGRTRMAAVFSALWTALTILLFAPVANYIPIPSLAGMLIVIAWSMIDKHRLALAWRSGLNSRVVLFGTLGSTLIFPLEYAIFIGVFLSIFFLLKITGKTDLTQLVPRQDSGFDEVPFNRAAPAPVVMVNLEGDLYFAAVEDLDYELQRALTSETRVVILRMKRLRAVGSSAIAILEHFRQMLRARGVSLVICGVEPQLESLITSSGLRHQVGEPNIFYADNKLFQSTELAFARAMSIVEMQRRRDTEAGSVEATHERAVGLTARSLMTRHCVRFGHEHQLREAVWLMSEMSRRMDAPEAQPLFLQNREGRLAGKVSTWRVLREMVSGIDRATLFSLTDDELASQMRQCFPKQILGLARTDIPRLHPDTRFPRILSTAVREDMRLMPVCDDGERVMGLIGERDLLAALASVMGVSGEAQPRTPEVAPTEETATPAAPNRAATLFRRPREGRRRNTGRNQ